MRALLMFISIIATAPLASGHARLLPGGNTPGRNNSAGLKSAPCGGVIKGNPVATFNQGQTLTVQWEETINHPGYFEISISSDNDQSFTLLTTVQDNQNNTNDLPHRYQVNVQLPPGLTCSNCTLRMVQQMTENPNNPRPYFSCADIEIANQGADTPMDPIDETQNSPPQSEDCH